MVSCPVHPDSYFVPGDDCELCMNEVHCKERDERAKKEKEKELEAKVNEEAWYKEGPGRKKPKGKKDPTLPSIPEEKE